ncbi:hypothetical protein Q1695_007829 [Nippostrongylus brasiliensis]|nr:hypothetical protein Q1695_007829 [Nippostrongylus brasiliensis]
MDDDSQPAKPLFTMNTDQEAVLIGIIYISLSGFMIPFYLIFLWVMCTSKDLKKVLMYRLMNHINLIDFGQLVCHFISGFFPIFPEITRQSPFFSSFIGSTVNSFWQAMFPYICVLSVSRILIIKKRMDSEKLNLGLKIGLGIGWLFSITVWLWSWLGMAFVFGHIGWTYDFSRWSSWPLKIIEIAWCWPIILISYLSYVGIIINLISSKKTVSGRKSYRNEILIFCQATFLNGWMLGLMASWHGSAWLGLTKNYHQCIIDCVWILFSYLNPILLFVLNRGRPYSRSLFVTTLQIMEDAQQPLLTVNTDQEAVLIGIIYVSLSVVLIIPFGLIFNLVILKDKELRGLMMYRLMNHLNWINFGQSICNLISGFFPIFPEIPRRMPFFANLIGSLANSLWLSMFPYIGVLSVSRILIIRKMMDPEKLNILLKSKKAVSGEKSYKDEIMIFCQATFLNGWTFGVMLAWHSIAWLQITATYYAAIVNCAWILSACMNPIALFVINRTIRHKVIQFVLPKRRSKVGSTQQTTITTF